MAGDRLTDEERARLGSLLQTLHCDRVRLYRANANGSSALVRRLLLWLTRYRAVTLGNHVFLPDRCSHDLPVLAHELTHCCQYQAWGPLRYFGRGSVAQLRDLLYRWVKIGTSPYRYRIEPGRPFSSYGMEQQGQIVEDCFRGDPAARELSPFRPGETG